MSICGVPVPASSGTSVVGPYVLGPRIGRGGMGEVYRARHERTVTVHDHGQTSGGRPYYAMDLVEGCDLELLVRRQGPLPAGRVIRLLRQICDALEEAHALGIVHRDVKPANLVLAGGAGDRVRLLDFGLAAELSSPPEVTQAVIGTPAYLAPESMVAPETVDW